MFKDAKSNACDKLVVALQTDPTLDRPEKNKCVQPSDQRLEILNSIKYIDEVFLYDTEDSLYALLERVDYDVRILGTDYENREYTGKDLDPEVYYHHRDHDISTSKIKELIFRNVKSKLSTRTMSTAQLDILDKFPELRDKNR